MKNRNHIIMSVLACLFSVSFSASAEAREGVGHGGGAEWNVITCEANVKTGQKISLSVCLTGDTNEQGKYELIPCGNDRAEFVTIERRTKVARDADQVETLKIPGRLFDVDWQENAFYLTMNDPIAGKLALVHLGNASEDRGTTLELNLPSMKHNLRSVSCEFGSN